MQNDSSVSEFILMGLSDRPELQLPLFVLFLVNYTTTVVGNLCLMSLICLNSHLHTPMYFFLLNLAFIDFCYSFVFTPKTLMSFVLEKNTISVTGCMTQLFFFLFLVNTESYVLTVMAYDRYVAICKPLLYKAIMSPKICCLLIFVSYLIGFITSMAHTGCMIRLSFCDSNIINHYMCDIFPLLQLSCSSTYINELLSSVVVGTAILSCSLIILVSYAMILSNIIRMSSAKGWSKAMGTCGSHIITVTLFYGSGLLAYVKPSSPETVDYGKFFSVFYTFLVPMVNPLIYSLRNKDVLLAVKRTLKENHKLIKPMSIPIPLSPLIHCLFLFLLASFLTDVLCVFLLLSLHTVKILSRTSFLSPCKSTLCAYVWRCDSLKFSVFP